MDTILILERLDRLEQLLIGNKEVLTFDETCDYTGISRSYLYKLTASGKIPHSKPNGKMLFFEKKEACGVVAPKQSGATTGYKNQTIGTYHAPQKP